MAPKARIRKDVLLRLLQEGHDPTDIHDNHWEEVRMHKNDKRPSLQAFYVPSRKYVQTGQLPSMPDGRSRGASKRQKTIALVKVKTDVNSKMTVKPTKVKRAKRKITILPNPITSLDQDIQGLIKLARLAAEVPTLKKELKDKNKELERYRKEERERIEQGQEYYLAKQQAQIGGGLPGKANLLSELLPDITFLIASHGIEAKSDPYLTYHIDSELQEIVAYTAPADNIMSGAFCFN